MSKPNVVILTVDGSQSTFKDKANFGYQKKTYGFELTKQGNGFQVTFDHFQSKRHFSGTWMCRDW
jgi:hypothetical protein